jgi:hypothetical protein
MIRAMHDTEPSPPPTFPPSDVELEGLAAFELMIKEQGELDARYAHTTDLVESLFAAQPEG